MLLPPPDVAELALLAQHAPLVAQAFAKAACDIALVLDPHGVIRSAAHGPGSSLAALGMAWVGRPLADTVTADTRHKIIKLLVDVARDGIARRREVNLRPTHSPSAGEAPAETVAVAFTALSLGPDGPAIAVGQDLRAIVRLQERFVRVQQELERAYAQALAAERAPAPTPAAPTEEAPLDDASRAAFAAWLHAERMGGDPRSD
jgi:hypothetical protein